MTKTEAVIYSILGPTGGRIRALACAVDVTAQLLFVHNVAIDDIKVTKDVYPVVARRIEQETPSVSRQVERLANACWDKGDRKYLKKVIGRELQDIRAPRDMLFYLAVYIYLDMPFFKALEKYPEFLF